MLGERTQILAAVGFQSWVDMSGGSSRGRQIVGRYMGPPGSTLFAEEDVCNGEAGPQSWKAMARLAVMGQGLTQLPCMCLLEENKEGPLCNRKNHFMKLCNALGPIGGGGGD